jgi:ubiquinone/menaquinone biosynthesis C-methylase UbiE
MPEIDTPLHIRMWQRSPMRAPLSRRLYSAVRQALRNDIYGLEWGDPDTVPPLRWVRDRWVAPYVDAEQVIVEIGPGGGRWTRYLLGAKRLYLVDYHDELLHELRRHFDRPNMVFVRNSGTDLPTVPSTGVDFVFSFGCFVHLDQPAIAAYLSEIRRALKPGGNVVLQYSDKTKIMARENHQFSENTPEAMRALVVKAGFAVVEEDLTTLWHSSLIRLTGLMPST